MKLQNIAALALVLLIACKGQDSSTELIQSQNRRIDSLLQRTVELEKKDEKSAINPTPSKRAADVDPGINVKKYVVSKITCIVNIPEYRKLETEPLDYDGPVTDVETMKAADKLRQQRNSNLHEIVYVSKTLIFYSEIKEIDGYNEEKKYRFLDKVEGSLRRKNENIRKVLKRECLVYNTYTEASQALESIEQNANQ